MSLASWKKEFYRKSANKVSKRYALRHSLRKWIGLKPCNRKKHSVSLHDGNLMNKSVIANNEDDGDVDFLKIDDSTCALCYHFSRLKTGCEECPLVKAGISECPDDNSPFDLFMSSGRVSPMIRALERALPKGRVK